MIELGCDTCGHHLAVILEVVEGVVTPRQVEAEGYDCRCPLTPDELMDVVEDAYSAEF